MPAIQSRLDANSAPFQANRARMLAPLPEERRPTLERWQALERRTKEEFDRGMTMGKVDHSFWWTFHTYLLQELDALDNGVRDALVENTQNSANWDQILPGTREALERIRSEYAIAVISNADGKIDAFLGFPPEPQRLRAHLAKATATVRAMTKRLGSQGAATDAEGARE